MGTWVDALPPTPEHFAAAGVDVELVADWSLAEEAHVLKGIAEEAAQVHLPPNLLQYEPLHISTLRSNQVAMDQTCCRCLPQSKLAFSHNSC